MIAWVLGTLAVAALVFVLLSPLESLRWWADRGEREVRDTFELLAEESCGTTDSHRFLVYLSGVGVLGGDELSGRELAWLESVAAEVHAARQRWAAYRQRGYELQAFDAERRVAL